MNDESPAARLARAWCARRGARPSQPSLRRQLAGAGLFALVCIALDLFSAHVLYVRDLGLIYFLLTLLVAAWAGPWAALGGVLVLSAHLLAVQWLDLGPYGHRSIYGSLRLRPVPEARSTLLVFGLYALLIGLPARWVRAASIRAYDARREADAAEEGRRANEAMRRLVVDASPDAIVVYGEDGAVEGWNPHAQALFGWSEDEVRGRTLAETLLPARLVGPHLRELLHTGAGARLEARATTRDGDEVDVEATVVPHRDGDRLTLVMFLHDIGERKRAEQAIREMNADLEARVAERTGQLEAANAELAGFNHSVSHDLRAPLRAIVANARILVEDAGEALDEEARERLGRIDASARRMDRLIASLLEFSRVGQAALRPREVDLSTLMATIADELRAVHGGMATVAPGMRAWADPDLISLVAQNLLDNAWKYVRKGEPPCVEIGRTPEGAFFVRDQGVGFDMAHADKVWEPFERLHREDDYPGTGIGLANCRRVVRRHGGEMRIESIPGVGTTVTFTLPEPPLSPPGERGRG